MKLLRYGQPGKEKPGPPRQIQPNPRPLRRHPRHHRRNPHARLPKAHRRSRSVIAPARLRDAPHRPLRRRVGKFICIGLNYSDHAAESGMKVPTEPVVFMKATSAIYRPQRQRHHPPQLRQNRLGSRTRRRHRHRSEIRRRIQSPRLRRRLLRRERPLRAHLPARRHRPMGKREERRHIRPDRAMAGHQGRSP